MHWIWQGRHGSLTESGLRRSKRNKFVRNQPLKVYTNGDEDHTNHQFGKETSLSAQFVPFVFL